MDETPFLSHWTPGLIKFFQVIRGQLGWISYADVTTERTFSEASGKGEGNGFVASLPVGTQASTLVLWKHECFFLPVFCT